MILLIFHNCGWAQTDLGGLCSPNSRRIAYVKPSSALFLFPWRSSLSAQIFSGAVSFAQILFHLHLRCLSLDGAGHHSQKKHMAHIAN